MEEKFLKIKNNLERKSNFEIRIEKEDNSELDKDFMKENKKFYEEVVKPTVRSNYKKNLL